MLRKGDWWS